MNWFDSLETFSIVAETKSFIQAAHTLGITNSAITKRIQWLEEKLECTLFTRTTRKVTLTEIGEKLFYSVKSLLNEWHDIQLRLMDEKKQPSGEIVICLPPNISGLPKFVEVFCRFSKMYPKLHLHIRSTAQPINLITEKIDILIATEKYIVDPNETIGVKLFDFSYGCFASKLYFKKNPEIKTPAELKNHNCILYRNDNEWEFDKKKYAINGTLRADSGDTMIAACLSGLGLIHLPAFMIEKEIKAGSLKPVLEKYPGKRDKMMAFYIRHEYKPRKITLFMDFLKSHFD